MTRLPNISRGGRCRRNGRADSTRARRDVVSDGRDWAAIDIDPDASGRHDNPND